MRGTLSKSLILKPKLSWRGSLIFGDSIPWVECLDRDGDGCPLNGLHVILPDIKLCMISHGRRTTKVFVLHFNRGWLLAQS